MLTVRLCRLFTNTEWSGLCSCYRRVFLQPRENELVVCTCHRYLWHSQWKPSINRASRFGAHVLLALLYVKTGVNALLAVFTVIMALLAQSADQIQTAGFRDRDGAMIDIAAWVFPFNRNIREKR